MDEAVPGRGSGLLRLQNVLSSISNEAVASPQITIN
jgi:hypothetical protein